MGGDRRFKMAQPPPYGSKQSATAKNPYLSPEEVRRMQAGQNEGPESTLGPQSSASDMVFHEICNGIKRVYTTKIKPLEEKFLYPNFHSPCLTDGEIDSKPMVMVMGQYSVGKTTFIKTLLGRDFPGAAIGPEPTTDRFMAVVHGNEEKTIPGNALALQPHLPFGSLGALGTGFLSKFEASVLDCPMLKKITLIDTPGVLSGEKQRIGRNYEFPEVIRWFADRVDRILLLFDAHKLDISDEFKSCLDALKGHDDKIRVVLNKSDSVDSQQLMRVHGALMWSLGKCIGAPEVVRVYVGSFWDKPYDQRGAANHDLFEREKTDLINDLKSLPANSALRKVNELIKRTRLAKVHALIIGYLHEQMPMMWGIEDKQQELINDLPGVFNAVRVSFGLAIGDFPHMADFKEKLVGCGKSFKDFPGPSKSKIKRLQEALDIDIPNLIRMVPGMSQNVQGMVECNPFDGPGNGAPAEKADMNGIDQAKKEQYANQFMQIAGGQPKMHGSQIAPHLQQVFPDLPREAFSTVWKLSDIDKDGALDCDEYCVAMHLCQIVRDSEGNFQDLPATLPLTLMPASKY